MIPGSPEYPRGEVLAKAPFLRTFLDERLSHDTSKWSSQLKDTSRILKTGLQSVLGKDYEITTTIPLSIVASQLRIFNPQFPNSVLTGNVNTLQFLGYETLDVNKGSLLTDITVRLAEIGAFNPKLRTDEERLRLADYT